jgi:hypothetical protein
MKLSAIRLEASVIQDLYKKYLVEAESRSLPEIHVKVTAVAESKEKSIAEENHFLGENKKNILILVNYKHEKYVPEEDLAFFITMLSACRLSLADVAIMNLNKTPDPSYKDINSRLNSRIILLFGIAPSSLELPVDFPHFQVQSFNNCIFLYTPSPGDIKEDKILKSKLWVCLRKIFNL